jgi:hypothetical protein
MPSTISYTNCNYLFIKLKGQPPAPPPSIGVPLAKGDFKILRFPILIIVHS